MSELGNVVSGLLRGDPEAVLSCFEGTPRVHAQRGGRIEGRDEVSAWVTDTGAWFRELKGEYTSGLDITAREGEPPRLVHDTALMITTEDGRVDLPFVAVADVAGGKISELRTYHSSWPYTKGHTFRDAVAQGDISKIPKLFADYIDRLVRMDVEPILATFTDDAVVREPSGSRYKYEGSAALGEFYRSHISDAPQTVFDLRTCTNGENISAVEYAFAYGDVPLVGGVCIMEFRGDKISAVRITDDVGV